MQIVIGLVGPIASGKGTLASFLKKRGFNYYSLSDVVRHEATQRGLELTRENLQNVGNDLRNNFGGTVLVERLFDFFKNDEFVIIDGVRNPLELLYIKEQYQGKIVEVASHKTKRLERYLERAKKRGEDTATKASFEAVDARDLGKGEGGSGQQVAKCLELSDFRLTNNTTLEDFERKAEEMLDSFFIVSHKKKFSEVILATVAGI